MQNFITNWLKNKGAISIKVNIELVIHVYVRSSSRVTDSQTVRQTHSQTDIQSVSQSFSQSDSQTYKHTLSLYNIDAHMSRFILFYNYYKMK